MIRLSSFAAMALAIDPRKKDIMVAFRLYASTAKKTSDTRLEVDFPTMDKKLFICVKDVLLLLMLSAATIFGKDLNVPLLVVDGNCCCCKR